MKWKLFTRVETVQPAIEGFEPKQHDSKEAALQEACATIRQQPHTKVLYIEGPDGERIESAEIEVWCKARGRK
jgi:hypothetical protein